MELLSFGDLTFIKGTNTVLFESQDDRHSRGRTLGWVRLGQSLYRKVEVRDPSSLVRGKEPLVKGWQVATLQNTRGSGWDWYREYIVFNPAGYPQYDRRVSCLNTDPTNKEIRETFVSWIIKDHPQILKDLNNRTCEVPD